MRLTIILLLSIFMSSAWAEKAGLYLGAGALRGGYTTQHDQLDDALEDEAANGWRLEVGYIWDIGKPGGFHLGVAGAYDDFGTFKGTSNPYFSRPAVDVELEGNAFSVYFVGEQQLARWCHFTFKAGPSLVDTDLKASAAVVSYSNSDSQANVGFGGAIGFTFFPTDNFAIELANQVHVYVYEVDNNVANGDCCCCDDDDDYESAGFGNFTLSAQYRF